MIKNFLIKQLVKTKLKHLPQQQQDMIVTLFENKPELFEKLGQELQQKMQSGMNQQAAIMRILREHQSELQEAMMAAQSGSAKKDEDKTPEKKKGLFSNPFKK